MRLLHNAARRTFLVLAPASVLMLLPDSSHAQQPPPQQHQRIRTNAGMPQVSPNGKQVLFISGREGPEPGLYVMNIDGTGVRRLRDLACCGATWHPDGKRIIVSQAVDRARMLTRIFVANLDGSDEREIVQGTMAMGGNVSPDGRLVAYNSAQRVAGSPSPKFRMHIVGIDGSNPRPLGDSTRNGVEPKWSPDGKRLAFITMLAGDSTTPRATEISLINADGSGSRVLAKVQTLAQLLSWSPDGKRLAFQGADPANARNEANIYVLEVETGHVRTLTRHDAPRLDETPVWLPDGSGLLFQSNRDGQTEIYRMAADGSNQRRLTR